MSQRSATYYTVLRERGENGERTGTPDFPCASRSSGRSTQRLWTHSQTTASSSWAAHLVTVRRSSCSSWLPKVSKSSRSGSRTILGRLCGCCTRQRSSAGKSSWALASSEHPHCCNARCASRGKSPKREPLACFSALVRTFLLRQQLRVPNNFPEMTIYIFEIP